MFEISCILLCGKNKRINDDRILVNGKVVADGSYSVVSDTKCLVAVCDGVGGANAGYKAAQVAAQSLAELFTGEPDAESLQSKLNTADSLITELSNQDYEYHGMSTTVSGIFLNEEKALMFNIGDSRVYRFRRPFLSLMTTDDTVYEENIAAGLPVNERQKHILTKYLGGNVSWSAITDISKRTFKNDIYLVCSDGVYDYIDEEKMEIILCQNSTLESICQKIAEEAEQNQSQDDMSIICVRRINDV